MFDNHLYDHACLCEICQETRRDQAHAIKMSQTKKKVFRLHYNRITQESHHVTDEIDVVLR